MQSPDSLAAQSHCSFSFLSTNQAVWLRLPPTQHVRASASSVRGLYSKRFILLSRRRLAASGFLGTIIRKATFGGAVEIALSCVY